MDEKKCFKCSQTKPLTEFYGHPAMADGHLNKCKACTRRDTHENYVANRAGYAAYDHKRQQDPARRRRKVAYLRKHDKTYPQRYKARYTLGNAVRDGRVSKQPCRVCGAIEDLHAHHPDYSKPLEVEWYCGKHHRMIHGKVG